MALSLFGVRGQESAIGATSPLDLKKLSVEQLLETEVTTVSRKPQPKSEVPNAIDVITGEEIRRSGVTTIPDALRLATGVHVARTDGHTWGITARGFNRTTANKMNVMMDGRSLYSPLFAGAFWDVQHYLLEDIDRIEVIRGPGATIWGANSFSGVINIITKSARDTQGTFLMGGGGTEENGFGGVRYGGRLNESTYYRAYATYFNRDGLRYASGDDAHDEMMLGQAGFRTDSYFDDDLLTVQGDYYDGIFGERGRSDSDVSGGNLLSRWTRTFHEDSELTVQMYFDHTKRIDRTHQVIASDFKETRNTFDLDVQHRFAAGERNEVVYGMEYRFSSDRISETDPAVLAFDPTERALHLVSGFIQDEITLVHDYLKLTVGSKFEYNHFSGFEVQPSARIVYTPDEIQTVWAGISRAVRTPSRVDTDVRVPPVLFNQPASNFESEELLAYELGYRVQPHKKWSIDIATFYNDYKDLRSIHPNRQGLLVFSNRTEGDAYGVEIAQTFQPLDWWTLRASYTFLEMDLDVEGANPFSFNTAMEGNDPRHNFVVHSSLNLPYNLEFDQVLRFVDDLPEPHVPGYLVLDLRLAWEPKPGLEIAVVGQNLLDDQHPEFGPDTPLRKEVAQSVYGKVTWRF